MQMIRSREEESEVELEAFMPGTDVQQVAAEGATPLRQEFDPSSAILATKLSHARRCLLDRCVHTAIAASSDTISPRRRSIFSNCF
ncbi:hypothetical protein EJ110_NYTH48223 [Nymphaea thermarum]|nr:hypothetical protein EJ110_NYTH48223 [Nymphaea thermarum]